MSNYTPGPWRVREESVGNRTIRRLIGAEYPGGHKPIATLHEGFTCSAEDAALIAASPDLIVALKRAFAELKAVEHPDDIDGTWAETLTMVDAAISKAEGSGK